MTVLRAPGRPRSPECEAAILDATLDLLAEAGLAGTTVEAVAALAGVGKATVYRRWPSKEAMVVDAIASVALSMPQPDSGDLRRDLVAMLDVIGKKSARGLSDRIMPRLFGEAVSNPELVRRYRERFIEPRRERFRRVLRGAIEAGELRADVDLERAVDLLVGPVIYRKLTMGGGGPLSRRALYGLVDDVLLGLAPR